MPRASGKCLALLLLGETICLPGPEKLWIRKNSDKWSTKMQLVCAQYLHTTTYFYVVSNDANFALGTLRCYYLRKCIFASSRLKLEAFLHSYFKKIMENLEIYCMRAQIWPLSCAFLCMSLLDRDVRLVSTQGSSPKGPTSSRKSRLVFVFH